MKYLTLIWAVWKKRKSIKRVFKEGKDVCVVTKKQLEDGWDEKDAMPISKELAEFFVALYEELGGNSDSQGGK